MPSEDHVRGAHPTHTLSNTISISSLRIHYSSSYPSQRCLGLISHVFHREIPDILCLQEVRPEVRAILLGNLEVRGIFLTTDAEPNLEDKHFTTMTLLSKRRFAYDPEADVSEDNGKFIFGRAFRQQLPSATGRDGLCLDVIPPYGRDTFFRITNVHLESRDAFCYRNEQLHELASAFREPGCSSGLIVGDFNSVTDEDHKLIEENNLEDAWLKLHGNTNPGETWNVGRRRDSRHGPTRLDKVAMVGLVAESMQLMHPLSIEIPRPGGVFGQIQWSDHSGLRCKFSLLV
jgi:tyrosyl-DNA phosphodiesterase 2